MSRPSMSSSTTWSRGSSVPSSEQHTPVNSGASPLRDRTTQPVKMTRVDRSDVAMKARFNVYTNFKRMYFVTFGIYSCSPNTRQSQFTVKCVLQAEKLSTGGLLPVLEIVTQDAACDYSETPLSLTRFKGEERDCEPKEAKFGTTALTNNLFIVDAVPLPRENAAPPTTEPCPIIRRKYRQPPQHDLKPPLFADDVKADFIPEIDDGFPIPFPEGHPRNTNGDPIVLRRPKIPDDVKLEVEDKATATNSVRSLNFEE